MWHVNDGQLNCFFFRFSVSSSFIIFHSTEKLKHFAIHTIIHKMVYVCVAHWITCVEQKKNVFFFSRKMFHSYTYDDRIHFVSRTAAIREMPHLPCSKSARRVEASQNRINTYTSITFRLSRFENTIVAIFFRRVLITRFVWAVSRKVFSFGSNSFNSNALHSIWIYV